MTVAENLKKIRKEKGFSQKEIAVKLGVSQPSYAQYENGKRVPKFETLQRIANALDCPVYDLTVDYETRKELETRITALEGIIAILKEIYGDIKEKNVQGKYGESFYYLAGKEPNQFTLYEDDIDQLCMYIKTSIPFLVDRMKDNRPEKEIIAEIKKELSSKEMKEIFESFISVENAKL